MDDNSNPRDKYINKIDYHMIHGLKNELDTDEASFETLVLEASEWLIDQGMEPYDQTKTRKFKSATTAGKSPTEALVSDLGLKCCLLSDFIEILRKAELESQANLFKAHLQGRRRSSNTGPLNLTRNPSAGDVEFRRKRTVAPAKNTDEEEDKDGGSPYVGEEEDPGKAVFYKGRKRSSASEAVPPGKKNSSSSVDFLDKVPSDFGLQEVLKAVPKWGNLAIALHVPKARVDFYKEQSDDGLGALCYWRDGRSEKVSNTWRFLLEAVKEEKGRKIAQDIEKNVCDNPRCSEE